MKQTVLRPKGKQPIADLWQQAVNTDTMSITDCETSSSNNISHNLFDVFIRSAFVDDISRRTKFF